MQWPFKMTLFQFITTRNKTCENNLHSRAGGWVGALFLVRAGLKNISRVLKFLLESTSGPINIIQI